ncbi:MAG: ABC transporter permease [Anaerolineae bacterium]|nr:ABC transporter permease [Anaerolineae bacterium]
MRDIINIALNDLRRTFADRSIWINLLIVPIIMTVVIGMANGGGGGTTRYYVDVLSDPSAGDYAAGFMTLLKQEGGEQFIICDLRNAGSAAEGCGLSDIAADADLRKLAEDRIDSTTTTGAILLPAGFTDTLLSGGSAKIDVLGKGGLNAPTIVQEKVDAVLTRLNGSILAARVAVEQKNPAAADRAAFYQQVYTAAESIWATDPVRIEEQTNTATASSSGNAFGQSAPGMGAMFVMINALGLATIFIQERQTYTLQRLLTMPLPKWKILGGKLLARYVLGLFMFGVLITVGTFFGVRWGDWLGVIATVMLYTLAVTAIALAFSTLVKTTEQAAGIALLLSLTLAPLGGAWWPLSIVPQWMQTIGHFSPVAWSQDAFAKLVYYGGGLVDILPQLGVLLLIAVVFFAFGISRFKFE